MRLGVDLEVVRMLFRMLYGIGPGGLGIRQETSGRAGDGPTAVASS
jgi:hypothetical protein